MEFLQTQREKPFSHIGINEFGFFVRQSETQFEGGNRVQENTFETWKQGKANDKICWTISVEKLALKSFVETAKAVYIYCECILVPENSEYSVEDVNFMLQTKKQAELTPMQSLQNENETLKNRLAEIENLLQEKQIMEKPKSKTKK